MVHLSICEFCAYDFATLILISSTHTDFVCCLQILLDQTQRTPEPYLNELFVTANRIFLRLHRQILLLFVQIKAPSEPSFSLFTKIMVSVFDVTNSVWTPTWAGLGQLESHYTSRTWRSTNHNAVLRFLSQWRCVYRQSGIFRNLDTEVCDVFVCVSCVCHKQQQRNSYLLNMVSCKVPPVE